MMCEDVVGVVCVDVVVCKRVSCSLSLYSHKQPITLYYFDIVVVVLLL